MKSNRNDKLIKKNKEGNGDRRKPWKRQLHGKRHNGRKRQKKGETNKLGNRGKRHKMIEGNKEVENDN